jgi:phosphate transport system substrate-binding protein
VIGTSAYSGFGDYLEQHHLHGRPLAVYEQAGNTEAILKRVAEDPSAIGVAAIGRSNARIRMVALAPADGTAYSAGSEEDARAGKYPLARYLTFYVRRTPGHPVDPLVREYFRLLLSKEGQQIIAAEADGYLPLTAREAQAELAKLKE